MFKIFTNILQNLFPKQVKAVNSPLSANEKNMTQNNNNSINSHIEKYLDYYCSLSAPGFAVLLKGEWGSGKTWFIDKYREKLKENNQKHLYVSLYGKTSLAEIGNALILQFIPILSSKDKEINILTNIANQTVKLLTKFDSSKISLNDYILTEYLKKSNNTILIFDDLERCQIEIGNILGYINSFVEHQGLKVVIIANEDDILNKEKLKNKDEISKEDQLKADKYRSIKEKLIGKTFNVVLDFDGALEAFICSVVNTEVRKFLSDNAELIQEVYKTAGCENLRILKQIVLDFERIFDTLPDKAKNKSELLQDILKTLMAFSIEIRRGTMLPKDISKLGEENISEEQNSVQKIFINYHKLNSYKHLSNTLWWKWWEMFFDTGILNQQELNQLVLSSEYFQDENTPDWVKLYYFQHLMDDEFDNLLNKVESEYTNGQFPEYRKLRVIQHITGLFLKFSHIGLYSKSKEEILQNSKSYIDKLKIDNQLDITYRPILSIKDILGSYNKLDFKGKDLEEFKEFSSYIEKVRGSVIDANMFNVAQDLLVTMQSDVSKFSIIICTNKGQIRDISDQRYDEIPILKYIKATDFMENFLQMKHEDQESAIWAIADRYELVDINNKTLLQELDWLKSIRNLLLEEAERRKGKLSGYRLKTLTESNLNEIIHKLEATK